MSNTYILEKRTSEAIWYDIDCTNMLDIGETITSIIGITADQSGLVFAAPAVNTFPVTFPDGVTALAGKVISVQISEGLVPVGSTNQIYTIRPLFDTNEGNTREATVLLNVTNIPFQSGRII